MVNRDALYGNKYVNIRQNELMLGPIKLHEIASQFPTPVFLFLKQKIRDNVQKIISVFQGVFPNSRGFYSMKSNYLPAILSIIKEEGFGAEIIDLPELMLLEQIKFPLDSILLGGPYFSDVLLEHIITNPPRYLVVYDLEDLKRLESAFSKCKKHIEIIVRFQAQSFTGRHGIQYNSANLQKMANLFNESTFVSYAGILSHSGTQLNSLKEYQDNIRYLIQIANELRDKFGMVTRVFNIGGGFPNADSITTDALKAILTNIALEFREASWNDFELFYEPGRFIVGDAGFCLARVVKYSQDQKTAYLDVGNNYIPKFMKSSLRFYNVSKIEEKPNKPVDFYGNIPSDQDILIKNYNFTPSIAQGDIILIANVGAYALTFSNRFPHARPYIILLDGEKREILHDPKKDSDFSL